jgi:arylsulfatase A-like enzyme
MKKTVLIYALPALFLAPLNALNANKPQKPNFVIINIDDLGYGDIGPYGSKLNQTPNLDRMAKEGRLLTSYYAAPLCSPSRAGLMTGCYPKRVLPIPNVLFPVSDIGLAPEETTVAELLKSAGYSTCIIGKWHLGDQPEMLPTRQGFDEWFGLPYSNDMGPQTDGVKSNFGDPLPPMQKNPQPPLPLMLNETVVKRVLATDQIQLVSMYTKEALRFISKHKNKPFFLYLAHNAVHFPLYPGDRFRGKSANGLYGDWVEEMDWSVGEVLNTLQTNGIAKNTLVIFTSDNGATPRGVNFPLRGNKFSTWEGGLRVPTIAWWPDKVPAGTSTDAICGMFDILPTFAAFAGIKVSSERKIDGADIGSIITGDSGVPPPHQVFYYFAGLQLQAVRDSAWKLILTPDNTNSFQKGNTKPVPIDEDISSFQLFNLKTDIGESINIAAQNPEIVDRLKKLVLKMNNDLGISGIGPGVRPMCRVMNPQPIIGQDGKVRSGLESKTRLNRKMKKLFQ